MSNTLFFMFVVIAYHNKRLCLFLVKHCVHLIIWLWLDNVLIISLCFVCSLYFHGDEVLLLFLGSFLLRSGAGEKKK
jgi:hypothetical protein